MLAHTVVAGKEQIKKINKQLRASQEVEPQKSEDSFKSATEGEETVSSEIEQVKSGPKVTSEVTSEESEGAQGDMRGMGQGVAESSPTHVGQIEEIGAMEGRTEELAEKEESVKERSGSREDVEGYKPKKKRSLGVRVPGTSRQIKKRKVASSIPVETPPTRRRVTRSQKKQSEAELEKALGESKRKATAKGKKNVVETVEAVEIDEMDLGLQDEER
ncbi:uncharacterized protein [Nicotiana tomentosiformis]|uniref:uncharacterized protein n=1 Tax=Nicotiana tomentosiformis TaxID=4098 RepID=UPI00388C42A9